MRRTMIAARGKGTWAMRAWLNLGVLLALAVLLSGCGAGRARVDGEIRDVKVLSQDPAAYVDQAKAGPVPDLVLDRLNRDYDDHFFGPWDQDTTAYTADDALWGIKIYGERTGRDEENNERPAEWMQDLVTRADKPGFPSLALKAITVRNTALRVMPTADPFYKDHTLPGEGPPFDYFQNSAIWAGTPVFISHATRDGEWLFAEGPFASGWVARADLALVDEDFIRQYRTGRYAALVKDRVPFVLPSGEVLFSTHVGALFPLHSVNGQGMTVLVPVGRNGLAEIVRALLPQGAAEEKPLNPAPGPVARVARELAGQDYGWGGVNEDRDCSAMVRDIFTPFGIWLPRNSTAQGQSGRVISLEGMSNAEKKQVIMERGVPFRTLVWLRGHIMLYLGVKDGHPVVFHNLWGVRVDDEQGNPSRLVLGRAVVTTLQPGKELPNLTEGKGDLLARVNSISILGE